MKVFLDASLFVYLNTLLYEERRPVEDLFITLLKEGLYTNLLVIDETLYISKVRYNTPYKVTLDFLRKVILPYAEIIPIDQSDIKLLERYLLKYALKQSDAIHLSTMEKMGVVNIVTEDEDFDRVKEIRRIWLNRKS